MCGTASGEAGVVTEPDSILDRIEFAIGPTATDRLLRARGGTEINIPAQVKGSWLEGLMGGGDAAHLLLEFGACKLMLPMGGARGRGGRKNAAKAMLAEGASASEVALKLDLHERTVRRHRAEMRDDDQLDLPFDN